MNPQTPLETELSPRAHRAVLPRDEWYPVEVAQAARHVPLEALVAVLSLDGRFLSECEAVRRGQADPGEISKRYVPRGKRQQQAIIQLLEPDPETEDLAIECGASKRQAIQAALLNAGCHFIGPVTPETPGRQRLRRGGTSYERAADLFMARANLRCLKPDCETSVSEGRLYCSAHVDLALHHQRIDQEEIRHLLDRCADALGIPNA